MLWLKLAEESEALLHCASNESRTLTCREHSDKFGTAKVKNVFRIQRGPSSFLKQLTLAANGEVADVTLVEVVVRVTVEDVTLHSLKYPPSNALRALLKANTVSIQ